MSARGISAFIFLVSLVFSMTILNGIGFYALMGADLDISSTNQDVQNAANQLGEQSFGEGRSSSILEGPLATVAPAINIFQSFVTVILNTSGVIQLLYGLPAIVADQIERLFKFAILVTIVYLIRSGSPV